MIMQLQLKKVNIGTHRNSSCRGRNVGGSNISIKSKFKTFFFSDDDDAEMEEDQYEEEY